MTTPPLMLLNDGETFTDVGGCLCTIPQGETIEEIEESLLEDTDEPIFFLSYGLGKVCIEIVQPEKVIVITRDVKDESI